jgi:hypothetical protein
MLNFEKCNEHENCNERLKESIGDNNAYHNGMEL